MRICARCVLPDTFPGVDFDDSGLCSYCRSSPPAEVLHSRRQQLKARMEDRIRSAQGKHCYDCLVAYSGGKDSSYTLKFLKESYGLNLLAITIDNGFLSAQAVRNCKAITRSLAVDHLMFAPAPNFMESMYYRSATTSGIHSPAAITRASGICNSCINLINAYMMRTALQLNIPIIAGGYIGGQVPKDAAVLEVDPVVYNRTRKVANARYASHFGGAAAQYFDIDEDLIRRSSLEKLVIVNPMLAIAVPEDEIISAIEQLGWIKTKDTGKNSSNCRLNDLAILVHYREHGFNPYVAELAEQVRMGIMDRNVGLDKALAIPEASEVAGQAQRIGLQIV